MIIAGIFARGGSKGVVNKNLRVLKNSSLIERAVRQAIAIPQVTRVFCSTDSNEIAEAARNSGAEVPWLRPADLAQDDSREWDSWVHLVTWLNSCDVFPTHLVVVPTVAPLRTVDDLSSCLSLASDSGADVVMAVADSYKNPWFNMVTIDPDTGLVRLVNEPEKRIYNRQFAPVVYDVSTVAFVLKCSYLLTATSLYDGVSRAVILPRSHCVDIDTEDDFRYAEFLLSNRVEETDNETGS